MRKFPKSQIAWAALLAMLLACATPALAQNVDDRQFARDLTVAQRPIYEITPPEGVGRITFDSWVDRADHTYAIGQPLRVTVRPHQDAYLTVVDVGSSGRVTVLFPNFLQQYNRVHAGTTVTIPSARARWQIKANGPTGIDLIHVIASRRPLALPELTRLAAQSVASPVVSLGRSAETVARDLTLQIQARPNGAYQQRLGMQNLLVRIAEHTSALPVGPIIIIP